MDAYGREAEYARTIVQVALAAALSHLRARWLAEVEGALRDDGAFYRWWVSTNPNRSMDPHMVPLAADYLRYVLGAGAGGEQ
jgi:hypothetical protein